MTEPSEPSLLTRSVENMSTVLGVWHPSRRDRMIYAGLGDFLVPAAALLIVQSVGYRLLQPYAALNIQVIQGFAGAAALAMIAFAISLILLGKGETVWQLTIGLLWALVIGHLLSVGSFLVAEVTSPLDWMIRKYGAAYVVPLIFLLLRLGIWRGSSAFAAFILPTVLIALPWFMSLGRAIPDDKVAIFNPDIEAIYGAQTELLNAQIERLRPGNPDSTELFAVLGAGYPHEGVFRREVEAVADLLANQFEAADRVISLVNSEDDLTTYPLMNRVNLRAALAGLAEAMDPDDVALLYLTSHGSPGVMATNFYEVITRDVTPGDIDAALDKAGIGNAVIIVSACYSGSFVSELADPRRLVLTAADADSASFGCNDTNEWTDWGRAFFVDSLAETRDLRAAARMAQETILEREAQEEYPASSPQISEGADIGRVLDAWQTDLE